MIRQKNPGPPGSARDPGRDLHEAEIQEEIVEPWDARIDALPAQLGGKILIVVAQQVGIGCVVIGDQNGVLADADVAFQALEEAAGKVFGVPCVGGLAQAQAQLVDGCLGDKGTFNFPLIC